MNFADWALISSGGFLQAGIAYPYFAQAQRGWKVGSMSDGALWHVWYGMGALAYFAGMGKTFGWMGLVAAIPAAFVIGFGLTMTARQYTQLIALAGPILSNLWFMQR